MESLIPNITIKDIRDVTFNYAFLDQPKEGMYGTVYDIQLEFDKSRVNEMAQFGKVRELENGNYAINLTRKPVNSKGQKVVIPVVNGANNPMTKVLGNGSKGNVKVLQYDWVVGDKKGTKSIIGAIQVIELVEYKRENLDFSVVEEKDPVKSIGQVLQSDF